jgi:hypothetical protein
MVFVGRVKFGYWSVSYKMYPENIFLFYIIFLFLHYLFFKMLYTIFFSWNSVFIVSCLIQLHFYIVLGTKSSRSLNFIAKISASLNLERKTIFGFRYEKDLIFSRLWKCWVWCSGLWRHTILQLYRLNGFATHRRQNPVPVCTRYFYILKTAV